MHRWYDPATGRWISEDPIGFAAGDANLYRYVGNGVTGASDPSGLQIVFDPTDQRWPHGYNTPVHYDFNGTVVRIEGNFGFGPLVFSEPWRRGQGKAFTASNNTYGTWVKIFSKGNWYDDDGVCNTVTGPWCSDAGAFRAYLDSPKPGRYTIGLTMDVQLSQNWNMPRETKAKFWFYKQPAHQVRITKKSDYARTTISSVVTVNVATSQDVKIATYRPTMAYPVYHALCGAAEAYARLTIDWIIFEPLNDLNTP